MQQKSTTLKSIKTLKVFDVTIKRLESLECQLNEFKIAELFGYRKSNKTCMKIRKKLNK
jgi:hypothetical protein